MPIEAAAKHTHTFTSKARAFVNGNPVDQLVKQDDAMTFEYQEEEVTPMKGKDGDILAIFSIDEEGELVLRCKPSSNFVKNVVPTLRHRIFSASIQDRNESTKYEVRSNFCWLKSARPAQSRGAPGLQPVEVRIGGAFKPVAA